MTGFPENGVPERNRVLRLLGDLCNGQLDGQDERWLQQALTDSAEVRAMYMDYMAMDACLASEGTALAQTVPASLSSEYVEEPIRDGSLDNGSVRQDSSDGRTPIGVAAVLAELESNRRHVFAGTSGWALAASLACVVGLVSLFSFGLGRTNQRDTAESVVGPRSAQERVLARITGTQNCLWQQATNQPIGYGTELVAGQELNLLEGLAEITFQDGATVLLESPARFVVGAPHEVQLLEGRLAAVVPTPSRGFRVQTRSLDVFDVGTEFALVAKGSGTSEVHVFNGLLQADVLDSDGRPRSRLQLNASEAARVSTVSTSVVEFPADGSAFVRSLVSSTGPQDGLLAYEGFDYPEGPLDAQNGGFGWAGPWFSISADDEAGPDSNRVGSGSLTAKGIVPVGNRAVLTAQQNRIRRSLATSVGGVFDSAGLVENQDGMRLIGRDGHQVYISFLQRVSEVGDEFYGFELHRGDGNANRVLCIGHGAEGTGYGVTSNYNIYGLQNFPDLGREDTEVNFFVVKITFGVDNRDVVEVFRNPESLRDEQACSVDAVLKGNFAFDRISLASFHGEKIHEIDEIHIGSHFLAVTGRWGGKRGVLRRLAEGSRKEAVGGGQWDLTTGGRLSASGPSFDTVLGVLWPIADSPSSKYSVF